MLFFIIVELFLNATIFLFNAITKRKGLSYPFFVYWEDFIGLHHRYVLIHKIIVDYNRTKQIRLPMESINLYTFLSPSFSLSFSFSFYTFFK